MGLRLTSKSKDEQWLGGPITKLEPPALSSLRVVPGDVPAHGPPDELTRGALPRSPHGLSDLKKHGLMVRCWGGPFEDCITSVLRYLGQGLKHGQGRDHSNLEEQVWANKTVALAIRNLEGSKYSHSVFGKKKTEAQDTRHKEECLRVHI